MLISIVHQNIKNTLTFYHYLLRICLLFFTKKSGEITGNSVHFYKIALNKFCISRI